MVDYASLASIAEKLIADNGRPVTLTRESETPANASQPWRGNTTTDVDSLSATAVLLEYDKKEIDGDQVRRGDQKVLLAANVVGSAKDLKDYDKMVDDGDGEAWRIEDVRTLRPGPTTVIYTLQVRQ